MDNENLITVYLKLLSVLDCPVCLEYLTKPVAVCNEGHAVCSKCKYNVSNICPMCRNPMTSARGLIIDQVIDTLLYPCSKMGCGSLLKRSQAEEHDQTCGLDTVSDKQAVLHNNLLKNIEENFASFIVQPGIEKEQPQTRTVGTVTGKVKMADARIQTSFPFSVKLQSPQAEVINPDPSGSSSLFAVQTKWGPPGTSICLNDRSQNMSSGPNKMKPSSLVGPSSSTGFMQTNSINEKFNDSNPVVTEGFKFNMDTVPIVGGLWTGPSLNQNPQPFTFTSVEQSNKSGNNSVPKKPSTKLNCMGPPPAPGSNHKMVKLKKPTIGIPYFSATASTSSSLIDPTSSSSQAAGGASQSATLLYPLSFNENEPGMSRNKPSTKLNLPSTLNDISNATHQLNNSLVNSTRKRPSTNLIAVTTQ